MEKKKIFKYKSKEYEEKRNLKKIIFPFKIKTILIPSSIIEIQECAFSRCEKFKVVEFTNDSKLQMIEEYLFIRSSIMKLRIPSQVTQIGEGAFKFCNKLEEIEFPSG